MSEAGPARAVVSLVPSVTETLDALGILPVACTRFCLAPGIETVGGTKNPDVERIAALAPDLVVVNDEENRWEDVEALARLGVRTWSMSPRTLEDVAPAVHHLAELVGVPVPFELERAFAGVAAERAPEPPPRRVFLAVWRRPWMSANAETYASSLLAHLGFDNVCAGATDRYPEVALAEVAGLGPDFVLLPSEPYRFERRHVEEVASALPGTRVELVDGQDLFWWGARTPAAMRRLAAALAP